MCSTAPAGSGFWDAATKLIPLVEVGLLAITSFIAYKSLVAWREQAEYQSKRDAAKDIFRAATRCALWLIEARQSGLAPIEYVKKDLAERRGMEVQDIEAGKLEAALPDAFAKYLLIEKKSDFDELSMSLAAGKKHFSQNEIEEIQDLGALRDTIVFHSEALVDSILTGVAITDAQESRSFCYRLGDDHSIEDRIERALARAASL